MFDQTLECVVDIYNGSLDVQTRENTTLCDHCYPAPCLGPVPTMTKCLCSSHDPSWALCLTQHSPQFLIVRRIILLSTFFEFKLWSACRWRETRLSGSNPILTLHQWNLILVHILIFSTISLGPKFFGWIWTQMRDRSNQFDLQLPAGMDWVDSW